MQVLKTTAGVAKKIHLHSSVLITGLSTPNFTVVAFSDTANITSGLIFSVSELAVGHYAASVTLNTVGTYYLSITYSTYTEEYQVEVENEDISFLARKTAAEEGDYEITVTDTESAIVPGALVRIFNSTQTKLITKALTNSSGKAKFGLAVGSYKARVSKNGYDFSSINPITVTVVASTTINPVVEEFVPTSVSASSVLAVKGLNFSSTTVAFINSVQTALTAISVQGDVVLVPIPASASSSITFQLGNPDASNPGTFLKSKSYNILVT
jgi:hypothetical protein